MKYKEKTYVYGFILCLALFLILLPDPAIASPGGKIAQVAFKSVWGRIIFSIIAIILLPLIIYILALEAMAVSKARKALEKLGKMNDAFSWSNLSERAFAVTTHVYHAWGKADMERAREWMTHWYWQNQKVTVLEQWEDSGLVNHCKLNKIINVKPLHLEYREINPGDGEGSKVVLQVRVNLQDYLAKKATGEIVEGDEKNKELENIWVLKLEAGQWKLNVIMDSSFKLTYAKMKDDFGAAQEHLVSGLKFNNPLGS